MIITPKALKEMILKDGQILKKIVDILYSREMDSVIELRTITYNRIVREGLEQEKRLHLMDVLKDFIYSDINKQKFEGLIKELIK